MRDPSVAAVLAELEAAGSGAGRPWSRAVPSAELLLRPASHGTHGNAAVRVRSLIDGHCPSAPGQRCVDRDRRDPALLEAELLTALLCACLRCEGFTETFP